MSLSLNSYLKDLSYRYYISRNSNESTKIDVSIKTVESFLKSHFGNKLSFVCTFGSYTRDTILPRQYHSGSDVDIMIVFDHERCGVQPETYRNWLKSFAEFRYSRSSVIKDFPTVVLDMQHISFDLVPAIIKKDWYSTQWLIPDSNNCWQETDPNGFNQLLVQSNTKYGSIVKPIIRLLKAWNVKNDSPYSSYQLEAFIAEMNFHGDNYETGFYYAIENLPTEHLSNWRQQKVATLVRAKTCVQAYLEREEMNKAKEWLHSVLPY